MAFSAKRGRKYARRIRRVRYQRGRARTTGIRAPMATRGFYNNSKKTNRGGRAELKVWDSFTAAGTGAPASNFFALPCTAAIDATNVRAICQPTVGNGFDQRIGRRIIVKQIQINGQLRQTDGTVVSPSMCRLLVVIDMQANGTGRALIQDIIGLGVATPGAANVHSQSFMNLNNRSRFKIIADIKMTPMATTNVVGGPATGTPLAMSGTNMVNIFKKVNFPITFNAGTNSDDTTVSTGAILIAAIGQTATNWEWALTTRVRFIDP